MNNFKFENGKLTVPTPKGDIVVTVSIDCLYPGVFIDFVSNDIKDSVTYFEDDGKPSIQLATVEYNTIEKELCSYVWGNSESENYSYKAVHNDALIFNEDFEIFPKGTEITHNGKRGFIMGDNRDDCLDGYKASLNYYIKYALDEETYDDVLKRIDLENISLYDRIDKWNYVEINSDK